MDNRIKLSAAILCAAALGLGVPVAADDDEGFAVSGSGSYGIAGTVADFAFEGRQDDGDDDEEEAEGSFSVSLLFQGTLIDFAGEIICMAVDEAQGRAWIGAVVTENNSDNPNFMQEIHEPGRDVWFRVLDTGPGSADADRTTFLGFEGAGGIITSEEYCAARIWPGPPDDVPNARTNALVHGAIVIAPISDDDDDDDDDDNDDDDGDDDGDDDD